MRYSGFKGDAGTDQAIIVLLLNILLRGYPCGLWNVRKNQNRARQGARGESNEIRSSFF